MKFPKFKFGVGKIFGAIVAKVLSKFSEKLLVWVLRAIADAINDVAYSLEHEGKIHLTPNKHETSDERPGQPIDNPDQLDLFGTLK